MVEFQNVKIMIDGDQESVTATTLFDSNMESLKIRDLSGNFENLFENGIRIELNIPDFMEFNQGMSHSLYSMSHRLTVINSGVVALEVSLDESVYYALVDGVGKIIVDLSNNDVEAAVEFLLDSESIPRGRAGFKWENDEKFSIQVANQEVNHDFTILIDETCCGNSRTRGNVPDITFNFSYLWPLQ